jgi:large subunit ribosomal protein L24
MKKKNYKVHVKVGDNVKVISGQDKGQIGVVKTVLREEGKVIIEGVNIKFKHVKPQRSGDVGSIKQMEFPISSSNVAKYEE